MNKSTGSRALRWLRNLVLATTALAGSAQAATYSGVWDPPFGAPFGTLTTGLGWRGTATYFVPDSCELSGSGLVDNYGNIPFIPGNCGGLAAVTAAEVELFNVADVGQATLATLTFDPASFYVGVLQYVGGELEGLFTDFSNWLSPSSDPDATPAELAILDAFGPLNPYTTQFSLIFTLDGPRLAWRDCGYTATYSATSYTSYRCSGGINSNAPGFQPEFTITRVPEPGTIGLAGLALLLLLPRKGRGMVSKLR